MKIAPIDIAHKTFQRKVMGLDADEVADFLRDVADQMEELVREKNALREGLRQKDLQIMEYKERDETLKTTIQTATKMSDQIRQDSEREARLIIGDAQQKAELIIRDSRDSLKKVYTEISDIKRLRMQFEVNMRALCQAHVAMLEQSHLHMPDPQINLAQAAQSMNSGMPNSNAGGAHAQAAGGPMVSAGFHMPQNNHMNTAGGGQASAMPTQATSQQQQHHQMPPPLVQRTR